MTKIQLKRSNETGKKPVSLEAGEIALNLKDRKLFTVNKDNKVIELSNHVD